MYFSSNRHAWYESLDAEALERSAREGLMDLTSVNVHDNAQVLMCGPLPFMRDARSALIRRGIPASRISTRSSDPASGRLTRRCLTDAAECLSPTKGAGTHDVEPVG